MKYDFLGLVQHRRSDDDFLIFYLYFVLCIFYGISTSKAATPQLSTSHKSFR